MQVKILKGTNQIAEVFITHNHQDHMEDRWYFRRYTSKYVRFK